MRFGADVIHPETREVIVSEGAVVTGEALRMLAGLGADKVPVVTAGVPAHINPVHLVAKYG